MSLAMYRGVDLGIALVVTDELYGEKWVIYQDDNRMAEIEKEVVQTMIRALTRI